MIVLQSLPRKQAKGLRHRSRGQRPRDNALNTDAPCKGKPEKLRTLVLWCLGGKYLFYPHPKSTLLHPNATVALGCKTLHWVATGLSRYQIIGSTASRPLEFKGHSRRQGEDKPRQTKKLNSGRVALGCGTLRFLHCLLFNVSQKKPQLQNEPNFALKSPISNLKSSVCATYTRISHIIYYKLSPHLTPIPGYSRLMSAIVTPLPRGCFFCENEEYGMGGAEALLRPVKLYQALLSRLREKKIVYHFKGWKPRNFAKAGVPPSPSPPSGERVGACRAVAQRRWMRGRALQFASPQENLSFAPFFVPLFTHDLFMQDRKTLDDRAKMTDLERIRHSAAHIMATAILRLWPDAQFAAGPPGDYGFYYDVDLKHRISPEDFPKIEEEMKKEIKANNTFEKIIVTREQAIKDAESGRLGGLTERPGNPSKFKLGNLEAIPEGEPISYFKNGDFLDLCAGPHVMRTGNVGAFKLTTVASAYYKGDEKNPQLQRIYGTAFKNKTEMDAYFTMIEEAKKRDHRKIGAEMGLFAIDTEYVGPGLPLWLPKGTAIVEELEKLAKETEFAAGYVRVKTPHIAREKMYVTSGHIPLYQESMFPPLELYEEDLRKRRDQADFAIASSFRQLREALEGCNPNDAEIFAALEKGPESILDLLLRYHWDFVDEGQPGRKEFLKLQEVVKARDSLPEPDRYYLKAMNCPHHHRIFAAEPRSYRDLPLRLAEYGTCYRYEQSGELFGLMRVRSLNMNDAHIYCTPEQFASEFNAVNEMYLKYFKIFGLDKYQMRFSTHDPSKLGQKFVNEPELWIKTENMVRDVLKNSGINFVEVPNEAAFYGPKIDVQVWSAIGREFTIATNQVDFDVPGKFGLVYRDRDNSEKTPLCIHRAPLGTHERFIGFLIEHYAGNFPLWLAPEQVRILTIGDEEPLVNYAKQIVNELRSNFVRVETDFSSNKINGKIQDAEKAKVHTMLVIGGRDMDAGNVSVRLHGKGNIGAKPKAEVIADILASIKERRP